MHAHLCIHIVIRVGVFVGVHWCFVRQVDVLGQPVLEPVPHVELSDVELLRNIETRTRLDAVAERDAPLPSTTSNDAGNLNAAASGGIAAAAEPSSSAFIPLTGAPLPDATTGAPVDASEAAAAVGHNESASAASAAERAAAKKYAGADVGTVEKACWDLIELLIAAPLSVILDRAQPFCKLAREEEGFLRKIHGIKACRMRNTITHYWIIGIVARPG